ncbi:hypothetical protein Tco_0944364 [Tanacetum coccineum]
MKTILKEKEGLNLEAKVTLTLGRDLLSFIPSVASILPRMQDCPHCGAVKFYSKTKKNCCLNGRVFLTSNELPDSLKHLLTSTLEEAKTFRTYIRTYNNLFTFTSLGVRADANLSQRNNGIYTFRVQGQVYHFINDLVPENGNAKNLQLYFHDTEHEVENRLASCERLAKQEIKLCIKALENNPYDCFFRSLKDVPQLENYKIILKTIPSQDQKVYNKPEVSQVAALWVDGEGNGEQNPRDIKVKTHSNQSRKIAYYYNCYDALQYPLMFPFGELGWHQEILKNGENPYRKRGKPKTSAANLISPQNASGVEDLLFMEEEDSKKLQDTNHTTIKEAPIKLPKKPSIRTTTKTPKMLQTFKTP